MLGGIIVLRGGAAALAGGSAVMRWTFGLASDIHPPLVLVG